MNRRSFAPLRWQARSRRVLFEVSPIFQTLLILISVAVEADSGSETTAAAASVGSSWSCRKSKHRERDDMTVGMVEMLLMAVG